MSDPIPFVPRVATLNPCAETVERLRTLLARAESGELRGIAYAYCRSDGSMAHGWQFPPGVNRSDVIASTAILQLALVQEALASTVYTDGEST